MMETSTPIITQICNSNVQNDPSCEDLSEEDKLFFTTIRGHLDEISEHPASGTIEAILKYSKSL